MLEKTFRVHKAETDDFLYRRFYGEPISGFFRQPNKNFDDQEVSPKQDNVVPKQAPAPSATVKSNGTLPSAATNTNQASKSPKVAPVPSGKPTSSGSLNNNSPRDKIFSKETARQLAQMQHYVTQMEELKKYNKHVNKKYLKKQKEYISELKQAGYGKKSQTIDLVDLIMEEEAKHKKSQNNKNNKHKKVAQESSGSDSDDEQEGDIVEELEIEEAILEVKPAKPKKTYKQQKSEPSNYSQKTEVRSDGYNQNRKDNYSKSGNQTYSQNTQWRREAKKPSLFYEKYLDLKTIQDSRNKKQGKYFLGTVSVNEKCKWMVRIYSSEIEGKLTAERENMNRVIHDSEVYFEILPKGKGGQDQQKKFEQDKKIIRQSELKYEDENEDETKTQQVAIIGQQTDKEQEPESLNNKFKCRIVAVKKHSLENKEIVGKLFVRKRHGKDHYLFESINQKLPKFEVGLCPFDMRRNRDDIMNKYFSAQFVSWKENQQFPYVNVVKIFGDIGDIETECKALLAMNSVNQDDFSKETIEYLEKQFAGEHLSQEGEYIIPKDEYKKRHDLRNQLIFTIDPKTARDFDDALSVTKIPKDKFSEYNIESGKPFIYEVGIHIADVSYFVPENSPIDEDARKRTTSVYLIHRVLPMLPRLLCETMCSLNPGVERLAVSIWCYVDEEGDILEKPLKFGRSVIHSKARLTYETAQKMIQGKFDMNEPLPANERIIIEDKQKIVDSVLIMDSLARKIKEKRLSKGSIVLQNMKKKFQLDKRFWPIAYTLEERFEANFLVEEFMLLANVKVAEILADNVREVAVLRRHRFPSDKKIKAFEEFMSQLGVEIKVSKDVQLMEQIKQILLSEQVSSNTKKLIRYQLVYLLEAAEYFMVNENLENTWEHYALGFPCYTHFTSPIRRYPDVLVHRQLIYVMAHGKDALEKINKNDVETIMKKSNECKMAARRVSSGCEKIFMCLYLKKNNVFTQGIVTGLSKDSVQITIPDYDIKALVLLTRCNEVKDIEIIQSPDTRRCLKLRFDSKSKGLSLQFVLRETQMVKVWLGSTDSFPIDYMLKLAMPNPNSPKQLIRID